MPRLLLLALVTASFGSIFATAREAAATDPAGTIQAAEQVLAELVAIPAQRIPHRLLAEAQGVAIIPRVLKIGFIAGVRRGQGVVMTRDAEGEWSLPQFITLTGGSIGWQAGIQGTDVVLVFKTQTSVERFMKGKFTIGADAAAAAGPVGRNVAAATDAQLRAEILSYSRSRGLFAGVSIDGSVLEINQAANTLFYGAPSTGPPLQIPESANALRLFLTELTHAAAPVTAAAVADANAATAAAIGVQPTAPPAATAAVGAPVSAMRLDAIQNSLHANAAALHALLAPEWQKFLAVPAPVSPASAADSAALAATYERYSRVNTSPEFKQLAERPEFQTTLELLREYLEALAASGPILRLPQPPAQ